VKQIFQPGTKAPFLPPPNQRTWGDRREEVEYIYPEKAKLAINVALATGRPLLISGPSGCGKSSLAFSVARDLGWRFYEAVISSRTHAQDLLWQFDHLRRLNDASARSTMPDDLGRYVEPGPIWWAFHRKSALLLLGERVENPDDPSLLKNDTERVVVLLDEIDKADPDVPNNLLVPLGSLQFRVTEIDLTVEAVTPPLIFITTNSERDLPDAFLRRCVDLKVTHPQRQELRTIAMAHFRESEFDFYTSDGGERSVEGFLNHVAGLVGWPEDGKDPEGEGTPSTAEFLDTVRACIDLQVDPGSEDYRRISQVTIWKHGRMERLL
jgi:MoxR-like ATPase